MKRSGVTVWELLAVIIIVLFIAAILFPVFAKSRVHDRHGYCASNEKQLGLGIAQYVQDNDERMPNVSQASNGNFTWRSAIYDYVKSKGVYQCPSRSDKSDGPDGFGRSYAANYTGNYSGSKIDKGDGAFAGAGSKPVSLEEIDNPSTLITLCEVTRRSTPDFNIDNLAVFNPNNHDLWAGHTDGSNYAFADGHAKWYKPEDTKDFWHRDKRIPLLPAALTILTNAQKRARQ